MSVLELYLWKEWRDQRAGVFGLVVALPLLFVLATCAWDARVLDTALLPGVAASAGALIALLVVGTDLIPGEIRRARVRFLERMPAGLGRAFSAKLVFYAAFTLFAAGYAMLIAVGLHALRFGSVPDQFLGTLNESFVLPAIACALWVFAVSAWVPHGALALPAAAILVALLCSPAWFFFGPQSILQPTIVELRAFCALSAVGAAISAWLSFVRGYRFGADPARAARIGALTAVVCLMPAWGWCAWRWHAAHRLDPHGDRFDISSACLGEDGTSLFMEATNDPGNGIRHGMDHQAVRVDLRTGEWQHIGGRLWAGEYSSSGVRASPAPRVRTVVVLSSDRSAAVALDSTGTATTGSTRGALNPVLPAARDLGLGEHCRVAHFIGLGMRVMATGEGGTSGMYDPFRKRIFDPAQLFPESGERQQSVSTVIRPGRWWIVRRYKAAPELFDPETLVSMPPIGWTSEDCVGPVLADGRFLVAGAEGLCLYVPETGAREALAVRGTLPGRVSFMRVAPPFDAPVETFQPHIVVLRGRNWEALARLDLECHELVMAPASCSWSEIFACEDPDTVLVIEDRRRIARLHFGSQDREVIFPRAE